LQKTSIVKKVFEAGAFVWLINISLNRLINGTCCLPCYEKLVLLVVATKILVVKSGTSLNLACRVGPPA
jgi:hypothetical protein